MPVGNFKSKENVTPQDFHPNENLFAILANAGTTKQFQDFRQFVNDILSVVIWILSFVIKGNLYDFTI